MKKLLKLAFLPSAIICCSGTMNAKTAYLTGLSIYQETDTDFVLQSYITMVDITNKYYTITYEYIVDDKEAVECGYDFNSSTFIAFNYPCELSDPISKNKLGKENRFRVSLKVQGELKLTEEIVYRPNTGETIYFSENDNNKNIGPNYYLESRDPVVESRNYIHQEQLTFHNFEDILINNLYYDIDISRFRFTYQNGGDNLLKGQFRLALYDRYTLFPDFPIGENLYRYLSLQLNQHEDGSYYFTYAGDLYYDPVTHDSSPLQKEGYLKSDTLMLPFRAAEELKFIRCYLEFNVDSYAKYQVIGYFDITYMKKYFGECKDSEFCQNLFEDDDVNVREKVVEVII